MVIASRIFFTMSKRLTETIMMRIILTSTVKFIIASSMGNFTLKTPLSATVKKYVIITRARAIPKPHPIIVFEKSCPTTTKNIEINAKSIKTVLYSMGSKSLDSINEGR
jgi:hypothetical protein